jgi:D-3-phosphoglycerate dehydrogenase
MEKKMYKILITTSSFGKIDSTPLNKLKSKDYKVILNPFARKLTEDEILALIHEHQPCGILAGVEPLTAKVLKAATPHLKTIARCGIGMDSVDLDAAQSLNISVTNTPDAPSIPVAELTMGMILGLLRRIHITDAGIRANRWDRPMGNILLGKTVGIIGCGRIGTRLSKMLQSFECNVLVSDPESPQHKHYLLTELNHLLSDSDIISLHLPYCEETKHFINTGRLAQMKKGSFLINASRGGLVDEDALLLSLQNGHLAGAALDCFEQEPYQGPLKKLDNVLLTAHIGSYAQEGRIMMESQAVENLIYELKTYGEMS